MEQRRNKRKKESVIKGSIDREAERGGRWREKERGREGLESKRGGGDANNVKS